MATRRMTAAGARATGWTAVMGTGVVSLDLSADGGGAASRALLVLAGATWLALLASRAPLRHPAAVAATAVLGTRLASASHAAAAGSLLAAAALLWAAQLPRPSPPEGGGSTFLPAVATQSLAVLSATLAAAAGIAWLRVAGLGLLLAGLALYVVGLTRFDRRALLRGQGDQWIAGGALAISALACAKVAGDAAHGPLRIASLLLWAAAIAWLPALAAGELLRPRAGSAATRWSTVFPLGMYAAMSFAVARSAGVPAIATFARGWTWVAVGVWALVAVGATRSELGRGGRGE
jgi:Voltage-dependent anion channel